jgi:sodium/bile acid cotransporter 7
LRDLAVFTIFLVNGCTIDRDILLEAPSKIKLFAYIHSFAFLFFPLCVVVFNVWIYDQLGMPEEFSMGTLILACLPTTITSCTVLTSMGRGDHTSALIGAVTTNFAAIILSPILLGIISGVDEFGMDVIPFVLIFKLAYMILIPVCLGYFIQRTFTDRIKVYKPYFRTVNAMGISLVCYIIFCDNFVNSDIMMCPTKHMLYLLLCMMGQHFFFLFCAYWGARKMEFTWEETIAVIFSAPQKTLGMGILMITNLTVATSSPLAPEKLAMYALPLLMYHYVQLMTSGVVLVRLQRG